MPDHVKHPERYTCYTLDEPLIIGGGLSGNGSRAKARGVRGENEKSEEKTREVPPSANVAMASASPSTDPANDRAEGERRARKPIVFRPSATAAAAKRRRSGAVDAAAATATGRVSFAKDDDEDDEGGGGEEDERVAGAGGVGRARGGSARGTKRRFRRKVASEDEDA